jgi:hypothetical protein
MEEAMRFATIDMTSLSVGLVASILGLWVPLSSSADAKQRNRQQQAYDTPGYVGGVTVMPRNTPRSNVVCWTPCNQPGAIVMGARTPIRSFASRFCATQTASSVAAGSAAFIGHGVPTAAPLLSRPRATQYTIGHERT